MRLPWLLEYMACSQGALKNHRSHLYDATVVRGGERESPTADYQEKGLHGLPSARIIPRPIQRPHVTPVPGTWYDPLHTPLIIPIPLQSGHITTPLLCCSQMMTFFAADTEAASEWEQKPTAIAAVAIIAMRCILTRGLSRVCLRQLLCRSLAGSVSSIIFLMDAMSRQK